MKSSPLLRAAGLAPDLSAPGKAKVAALPQTCQVEHKCYKSTLPGPGLDAEQKMSKRRE